MISGFLTQGSTIIKYLYYADVSQSDLYPSFCQFSHLEHVLLCGFNILMGNKSAWGSNLFNKLVAQYDLYSTFRWNVSSLAHIFWVLSGRFCDESMSQFVSYTYLPPIYISTNLFPQYQEKNISFHNLLYPPRAALILLSEYWPHLHCPE